MRDQASFDYTPFLANDDDPQEYLRSPWRCASGVVASNGEVLVCVTDDVGPYAEAAKGMPEIVDRFRSYLEKPNRVWTDLAVIELPPIPACKRCSGFGHTHYVVCAECYGGGEFGHGRHTYTCKECDGEGKIKTSARSDGAKKKTCEYCHGDGLGVATTKVAGVHLQVKYLQRLKALPGCVIGTGQPHELVVYRFSGGFGAVMPYLS